jgi:hypothetical protein
MSSLQIEADGDWNGVLTSMASAAALSALESGHILHFPRLEFQLKPNEASLLDPRFADPSHRNISLSADGEKLVGIAGDDIPAKGIAELLHRFQDYARQLIEGLTPRYKDDLRIAPTSLRLQDVTMRKRSWRADDSRLHIDAFPSRPTLGDRVIRVFSNINQHGVERVWRVGEPFENIARHFLPSLSIQAPGKAWLWNLLCVTKSRRSDYDHLMLELHDAMKADVYYQQTCNQEIAIFLPGSTWICFSDQVSHAAMSGQTLLEQTFFLPPGAMAQPAYAPLLVLERLTGRVLI